jgi:hypothetical protein
MKVGDEVKFVSETKKEREYRLARKIVMHVVWIDDPRLMVESTLEGFNMKPKHIYNIEDVEVCNERNNIRN